MHIRDFYDYVDPLMRPNNNIDTVYTNYFPSTYILFALWNIPIYFFGLKTEPSLDAGNIIYWYKLLPAIFFGLTAWVIYKIGRITDLSHNSAFLMSALWVSCPLAFFSQFIFGQYDIFALLFSLLGIYAYLQKKLFLFTFYCSIAITFKYFPVFIYIPLLLMIEKRLYRILWHLVLLALPLAIQLLFYFNSPVFQEGVLGTEFSGRLSRVAVFIYTDVQYGIFPVIWFVLCGFAYMREIKEKKKFHQETIYLCLLIYSLLFGLVYWHPQWVIIITPFLAMTTFFHRDKNLFLILDLLLMLGFIGFVVSQWRFNVDQRLLAQGIWGQFNPLLNDPEKTFYMKDLFIVIGQEIYLSLFIGCILLHLIYKFPLQFFHSWEIEEVPGKGKYCWQLRGRFIVGIMIFIVPAGISYFLTLQNT